MNREQMKILCEADTEELKKVLISILHKYKYENIVIRTDSYILAEGDIPVCLVAHIDTVFDTYRNYIFNEDTEWLYDQEKDVMWKPLGAGFDDRAGIYSILRILKSGLRPHIIITDREEVGGMGAKQLVEDIPQCPFSCCNFLLQLDRRGFNDAVFYQCDNKEFIDYIESFDFQKAYGTFSDISFIAPQWGIAAVNLSVGFMDEHTESERLYCNYCDNTISIVKMILIDNQAEVTKPYIYVPKNISKMTKADTVFGF